MFGLRPGTIGSVQGGFDRSETSASIGATLALLCLVWLILSGALAYLSSAWAEPDLQLYMSGGLLVLLYFLNRFDSKPRLSHLLFLAISGVIVLRYLFWRVLYTICCSLTGHSCSLKNSMC